MLKWSATLMFALVGFINFAPLMGVLGVERLNALYGIEIASADVALLMRHRAVLFGIVGGYLLYAAVRPDHRPLATLFGAVSMLSYMLLYLMTDGTNVAVARVYQIDAFAVLVLIAAVILNRKLQTDQ